MTRFTNFVLIVILYMLAVLGLGSATSGECRDINRFCEKWSHDCSPDNEFMKVQCAKTCGECGVNTTDTSDPCQDLYTTTTCTVYAARQKKTIEEFCKQKLAIDSCQRTCGRCTPKLEECPDGQFGVGCIHACNCKNVSEICKKQTGECEQSGCAPGVKNTPGCLEECPDGQFGVGCIHKCNCKNVTEICKKQTGKCEQSGSAPGVKNTPKNKTGCLEECSCGIHKKEVNANGDFSCKCLKGYYNTDPQTCEDIDECKSNMTNFCGENNCVNKVGDYRCECVDKNQELIHDRICVGMGIEAARAERAHEKNGRNSVRPLDNIAANIAAIAFSTWCTLFFIWDASMMTITIMKSIYRFVTTEPYSDGDTDYDDLFDVHFDELYSSDFDTWP